MTNNDTNYDKKTGETNLPFMDGGRPDREKLLREMCELIRDTGTAIAAEPGYDDIRERIHFTLIHADRAGLTRYAH